MNETCGCCEGTERLTPKVIANRPGLNALAYRVGTHASFLETMKACLPIQGIALKELGISLSEFVDPETILYPLRGMTTRAGDDPAIAMLDAWATVADVLTFYQERIANEGYLRAATERRSILELGNLVGYALRPGFAASVYLAYMLEKDQDTAIIPVKSRVQSVPDPGELPQTFETAEELEAHYTSNILKQRMTQPQNIARIDDTHISVDSEDGAIYFQGMATNLKKGDPLLFVFGDPPTQTFAFLHVQTVETQPSENRTRVTVFPTPKHQSQRSSTTRGTKFAFIPQSFNAMPPHNVVNIGLLARFQRIQQSFRVPPLILFPSITATGQRSEIPEMMQKLREHEYHSSGSQRLVTIQVQPSQEISRLTNIQTFRVKAAPFGHNAPLKLEYKEETNDPKKLVPNYTDWPLDNERGRSTLTADVKVTFKPHTIGEEISVNLIQDAEPEIHIPRLMYSPKGGFDPPLVNLPGRVKIELKNHDFSFTFMKDNNRLPLPSVLVGYDGDNSFWKVTLRSDQQAIVYEIYKGGTRNCITDQYIVEMSQEGDDEENSIKIVLKSPCPVLDLDSVYNQIIPGSRVVITGTNTGHPTVCQVQSVRPTSRADYGITGSITRLLLDQDWLKLEDVKPVDPTMRMVLRSINVCAQSEDLVLAEKPIDTPISCNMIELDGIYEGLKPGQQLIVSGELAEYRSSDGDFKIIGERNSELVTIQSVDRNADGSLPGDKLHTLLTLDKPLLHNKLLPDEQKPTYKRNTVTIYGNVVRATHGETRTEILGSGDGTKALQHFTLRQSPLTYTSAPTIAGAKSTLEVRVNDIRWHEVEDLAVLKPTDRNYITETDEQGKTTIILGDGQHGARIPTGVENVKAVYRTGIGKAGNVKAGQITLLATRPLGVKEVINPQEATGGADRESNDAARRNVPLALMALDRLVSVRDYEDFTRIYAGIGKASAVRLTDGRRQYIYLTIAGADNIPIDPTSDLYKNLFQSLRKYGDPNQPLQIAPYTPKFVGIRAAVRLLPDYQWKSVEPVIRARLLDFFSFEHREFGQPMFRSEVQGTILGIHGVDYAELRVMWWVNEEKLQNALAKYKAQSGDFISLLGLNECDDIPVNLAGFDRENQDFIPAELSFIDGGVPETLSLEEVTQ